MSDASNQSGSNLFGGFLGGLRDLMTRPRSDNTASSQTGSTQTAAESAQQASTNLLSELDQGLKRVRGRIDELRKESQRSANTRVSQSAEDSTKAREAIYQQILGEIIALHQKLGTGLNEQALNSFDAPLQELEIKLSTTDENLEPRILRSLIRRIVHDCADAVWTRFNALLSTKSVQWPNPQGLAPSASPEQVERARTRELAEVAEAFLDASPAKIAARMKGIVTVWKANYPAHDSAAWQRVVIQGVGYGLLAQAVQSCATTLKAQAAQIRNELNSTLQAHIQALQQNLEKGVSSVGDADTLLSKTRELCDEYVPELGWRYAAPALQESLSRWSKS